MLVWFLVVSCRRLRFAVRFAFRKEGVQNLAVECGKGDWPGGSIVVHESVFAESIEGLADLLDSLIISCRRVSSRC